MNVTNNTSFSIIAFGYHEKNGYGADVEIASGETSEVNGPYLGEMGGGSCHMVIPGDLVCHEGPSDYDFFQVIAGKPLCLKVGDFGITVRHYEDELEEHVAEWRRLNVT